jgi:glyoxylase-like metal-dependent hydrolase (beta-lactamase superfamily II)
MTLGMETPAPGVRLVRAANPSPLTGTGTNSYIIGTGRVAIIDPGPALPGHFAALLAALTPEESVSHILVTHPHLDHSALAPALAAHTGAPVLAFGTATDGRSPLMARLADSLASGGEGLDHTFTPDSRLADGNSVSGPDWTLRALHTPGHLGSHLCFAFGEICFTGDHVMGWSTSLVSPPDGDMAAYMSGLERLQHSPWQLFLPGHGPAVAQPHDRLHTLIRHRRAREAQILAALAKGPTRLTPLTAAVYHDTPPALLTAAARNTLAHLIDLTDRKCVTADPAPGPDALFTLTG